MSAMVGKTIVGVPSPCVNVCRMDADKHLCLGCFRTLDEIAQWSRAADGDKLAILAAVEDRRQAHGPHDRLLRDDSDR